MSPHERGTSEEEEPLHKDGDSTTLTQNSRQSEDSVSSGSTASLVLENLNSIPLVAKSKLGEMQTGDYRDDDSDPEMPRYPGPKYDGSSSRMSRNLRRMLWIISVLAVAGWSLALVVFVANGRYKHSSKLEYDHQSPVKSSGKKVTLESVQYGQWSAKHVSVSWMLGANGEDGLLLETGGQQRDFLYVEDIRSRINGASASPTTTLMKSGWFFVNDQQYWTEVYDPSSDLKKVLVAVHREQQWRHSYRAKYFIFDVETQAAEPLIPDAQDAMVQLALWSPTNDAIVFVRDNNVYLRSLSSKTVVQITTDGGPEYFYGVPDWVYEEEVLMGRIATWWALNGKYIAFLRTNETLVPEYPVQYFLSRPSGTSPEQGQEAYPEVRQIKYPKAGAPNPVVDMLFYDVEKDEVFSVDISGAFADDNRIISECVWADNNMVLIRELNRESDKERVVLVDVANRSGKTVRTVDHKALDGGWVEPQQLARFIPADPQNGRPHDGYVDTLVHKGYDHLGYFTPLDSAEPIMLTSGEWETASGAQAIDLENNLIYFTAAKRSPTERHPYSVKLDGTGLQELISSTEKAWYDTSFSAGGGYALLSYQGPGIPWQKVMSTPSQSEKFEEILEQNKELAKQAAEYELPHIIRSNITIDGYVLQVMEKRPPHFDSSKKYPVLFHQYSGPGSQTVNQKFSVDFQSYVASSLGYVVVTVDGRGTGFTGRKSRVIVRGNLGHYEASDQISAAKIWSAKLYVDPERMSIWGWSYGGFMTLKVLEMDAGETFKYGMSVAPVTDWRFYDSVYTERYMQSPQHNQAGYESSAISNVTALAQNVRFLIMHGVADDNVHMQNTLTLLDKLDLAQIDSYDVHFFPDSDHGIYFHNANNVVYDKLSKWLVNAFNGEFYKIEDPVPDAS